MTSNHDHLVSPFLASAVSEVADDRYDPSFDGSAEGMQRLHNPFAVDPADEDPRSQTPSAQSA